MSDDEERGGEGNSFLSPFFLLDRRSIIFFSNLFWVERLDVQVLVDSSIIIS